MSKEAQNTAVALVIVAGIFLVISINSIFSHSFKLACLKSGAEWVGGECRRCQTSTSVSR